MSNRNRALVGTIVLAALPLLGGATAAVRTDDRGNNAFDSAAPAAREPAGAGLYLVRCWQYGRLLFEERDVQLATDVTAGLKLQGIDRQRQPVYVADTGNATCLIRSTAPRRR